MLNQIKMGIHIVNVENGKLRHEYVECYEELAYVEFITKDSIIYEGEENWKPAKISESKKYEHFSKGWFRAGIQAQELFKKQASKQGFILEELNQDQESFKSYTSNAKNISIKRGDFLIRNYGNIEIDIKCRGFRYVQGVKHFDFKEEDVKKHSNMQTFTKTPILIAVYENRKNRPVEDKVYIFAIDKLVKSKLIESHFREGIGFCYQIPLSFTEEGFGLIEKTYSLNYPAEKELIMAAEESANYNPTFGKWTAENDKKLEILFCEGYSINKLSKLFGENNGTIRARINELELNEKYGN